MRRLAFSLLILGLLATPAFSYDVLGKNASYLRLRPFYLLAGYSGSFFVNEQGIESDGYDHGFRLGMGWRFTSRLNGEFLLQYNFTESKSPDPLGTQKLVNDFHFSSQILRLRYIFDQFRIAPYLSLGVGLYQIRNVKARTGLDFATNAQMPVGFGLQSFLVKDKFSVSLDYVYHLLFNEEQESGVLSLLGVNEVSFDVQTISIILHWHMF